MFIIQFSRLTSRWIVVEQYFPRQVDKVASIRCGDWEACPLSPPQLQYAATDAFASLYLYQARTGFYLRTFQRPFCLFPSFSMPYVFAAEKYALHASTVGLGSMHIGHAIFLTSIYVLVQILETFSNPVLKNEECSSDPILTQQGFTWIAAIPCSSVLNHITKWRFAKGGELDGSQEAVVGNLDHGSWNGQCKHATLIATV